MVDATATATADDTANCPAPPRGSAFRSSGSDRKSGGAIGWTHSAGKEPERLKTAPNFQPNTTTWTKGILKTQTPGCFVSVYIQRTDFKILLLAYKKLKGLMSKYIYDLLLCYEPSRPLRWSGTGLLSAPRVKSTHWEAAFSFHAPYIYNKLPENCRSAATLCSFKSQLKTFLFATILLYFIFCSNSV